MNPTKNSIKRILAAGAIAALALVAACGGDSASGVAPPAIGSPPASTGELNPGLTGRFWYRPSATETYWTAKADTGATTKFVDRNTSDQWLTPSRDGTRYLLSSFNAHSPAGTDNEVTTVEVFTSATKTRIARFEINGNATAFRFSPDNQHLGMKWYPSLVDAASNETAGMRIFALPSASQALTEVHSFNHTGLATVYDFDWLPDNKYLYLQRDRKLILGSISEGKASEVQHGVLPVPTEYGLNRNLKISPDGQQIAVSFAWIESSIRHTDAWIAKTNGEGLERVSTGAYTNISGWSPDGKFIILETDAGFAYANGHDIAYCKKWYVPSTARNVSENSIGSRRLRYLDGATVDYLPCPLGVFWTN